MRRPVIATLAAVAATFGTAAFAQDGDLRGVTMRVLDDLADVDAVVIELGASNGEEEEAQRNRAPRDEADSAVQGAPRESNRFDEPKDLHDPDDDELAEGKLEDRDVEQPAPATP